MLWLLETTVVTSEILTTILISGRAYIPPPIMFSPIPLRRRLAVIKH
jgi:hypothetical protein